MFSSSTNTVLKYELPTNDLTSGRSIDHFLPANSAALPLFACETNMEKNALRWVGRVRCGRKR